MEESTESDFSRDLVAEAFSLLAKHWDDPAEMRRSVDEWAARSAEHAKAMGAAHEAWSLFGELPSPVPRGLERIQLGAETIAARIADRPVQYAAALIAAAAVMTATLLFVPSYEQPRVVARIESALVPHRQELPATAVYATDSGELKSFVLKDGSTVWLNWKSEIGVKLVANERHVDLRKGAAVFSVAEDSDRPFIVHAGDAIAKVVGTEFAVHQHEPSLVIFEVREGVVAVSGVAGSTSVELKASEAVSFRHGALGKVRKASLDTIGAWRDGLLVFEERPLIEVLEELGHYSSARLRLADIAKPERLVTATFFIDDADGALKSLEELFDLSLNATGDGSLVVRSNPDR